MSIEKLRQWIASGNLHKFYASTEWRKLRRVALKRDNYECKHCKNKGKYTKAKCVHHINEIVDAPALALTLENLISLCGNCHNIVHGKILKPTERKKKRYFSEEKWE